MKKEVDDTPEEVGGPGEAAGSVDKDEALKAQVEEISKAKKDDFLLYCMKYKATKELFVGFVL